MILLPDREKPDFPNLEFADEDGLLAFGGRLNSRWIIYAYRNGIFPWFNPNDPVVWWSPDPRMVLLPEELKVSRSMRPYLNQRKFECTINKCFPLVLDSCSKAKRKAQEGTWIDDRMKNAYVQLHHEGWAHSLEVWQDGSLVGGLYGLLIGKVFYGESMFSLVSNASKYGFIYFVNLLQSEGVELIDCQVYTKHLESLGARLIRREEFVRRLERLAVEEVHQFSEPIKE